VRRAALGVIRIILESQLRLPLKPVLQRASEAFDPSKFGLWDPSPVLLPFIADRLKVHLREQGVRHDLIAAVFALGEDDLLRLLGRVQALSQFLSTEAGVNLLTAYRRAGNIVAIEERRDGQRYDPEPDPYQLREPAETTLHMQLMGLDGNLKPLLEAGAFEGAMAKLGSLRRWVDEFFDKVTVNADDPALRENRLRLLSRIRAVMNQVADFSQIEG